MFGLLLLVVGLCLAGEPTKQATTSPTLDLVMPGAKPSMDDDYLCSAFDVSLLSGADDKMSEVYVTGFVPSADANKAHHMLLYSCDQPLRQPGEVYDCLHHALCQGGQSIMFAWAKNAPPTTLPQGVSFTINPAQRRYLVLQVHYAHKLAEPDHTGLSLTYQVDPTKYTAGILLMLRGGLTIPANTPVVHGDVNCKLPSTTPLHMFAYRTHAHKLSPVITGYVYNEEGHKYREIARGSPQWPQAFYPMKQVQTVKPGEIVAARCTYNSSGVNHDTNIGSTAGDEMCNLYIMFFTESGKVADFLMCANEQEGSAITRGLPEDSDKAPVAKPDYEAHAKDASVHAGPEEINYAKLFKQEQQESTSKKKGGLEETTTRMAFFNMTMPAGARQPKALPGSDLSVVPNWPNKDTEERLGQLSGVAIDIYGNAIIFHRGDRTWNGMTFKGDNTYGLDKDKPIPMDTILTVNATGHTINSWGKNMFFLPHMITVDKKNNIWLTDVALHQVFKFAPYGGDHTPLIALGERFVPGSDDKHYCKPTSVAVSDDTTSFYVSDGYCNSRVIKYGVTVTPSGTHEVKKLFEWGKGSGPFTVKQGPNSFNIPHGLALAEDRGEVCVADRENGRVQCFSLDGDFTRSIKPEEFGSRIFSVAYTQAKGGQLHAVSGPEFSINPFTKKPTGYIVNMESGELAGTWNVPGGLQNPHDIAVSSDGNIVYVVELNPFKVWKLTNGAPQSAPPSQPILPPTPLPSNGQASQKVGMQQLVPDNINSSVVLAAAISVPLTLLVALCLACRKCRKKGKGTMVNTSNKSRFKDWNVGDILGRNKDGFQPVNTEERDGMLDDDSDSEVEEFSIPANHA